MILLDFVMVFVVAESLDFQGFSGFYNIIYYIFSILKKNYIVVGIIKYKNKIYKELQKFLLFCYTDTKREVRKVEKSSISEIERKKRSLKRYKKNLACIDRLEDKLDLINDRMTSIKSPNLSGMPRGGQSTTIPDLVADKVELEERIAALKLKSRRLRKETLEEIDRLDDPKHVEVLEMFFIDRLSLEEIAAELNYSNRHVYRIYSESLECLADTPEESEDECQ